LLPTRRILRRSQIPLRRFCAQAQVSVADLNKNPELLDKVVEQLNPEALQRLQNKLEDMDSGGDDSMPKFNQLSLVALQASIPMIGFGFLDNFLMILMGASIEASFGSCFGLSVMASAACGNTLSDMGGVVMGKYVEILLKN